MNARAREVLAIVALALVLTGALAIPVLRAPAERVFGMEIAGRHHDPFAVMAQFERPPALGIYSQPFTDGPGGLLARAAGPVAAYNWLVLLTFPLSAAAAYLLARHMGIPAGGAALAAVAFAFSPFHLAHAAYHPHIAQTQWIPLYLLALWRCLDTATRPAVALLVLSVAAVTLSNFYGGLIAAVISPAAVAAYWFVVSRHNARATRSVAITVVTLACIAGAGLAYAAYTTPNVLDRPAVFAFPRADLFRHSAKWWSYLVPPVAHPMFGGMARDVWQAAGVREGLLEQQVSLGWAVVALGGVAVFAWIAHRGRSHALRAVPVLSAVAFVALVCSLSPERQIGGFTFVRPSALLYGVVPMFRSYARFGVVVQLMAALLAGLGAGTLWRAGTRHARAVCALLVALAAAEYAVWPPAMSRDVLPTAAHRWVMRQPGALRVLDCAPPASASESIPWLTADRITVSGGWLDDCGEPNVADRLAASGYTHLLVRRRTREGRWFASRPAVEGLESAARFRDGEVLAVTVPPPIVHTARMTGFQPREYDADWTWRWMGDGGAWTVSNRSEHPVVATLDIQIAAFHHPRGLEILLDGNQVQRLTASAAPGRRRVGPIRLSPGDHALAFHPLDDATVGGDLRHNGDTRLLSFALGSWRWLVEDDQ